MIKKIEILNRIVETGMIVLGQKSKHILLEKPMATKVDECAAMNAEVKKNLGVHFYDENPKNDTLLICK